MDSKWVPTEDQECDNVPDVKEDYKDEGSLPTKPVKALGAENASAVIQHGRSCSPVPSCLSMKSNCSMELPLTLKQADNTLQQWGFEQTTSSYPPGCLSIRSHQSMDPPFKFKDGATAELIMQDSPYSPICLSMKSNSSMELPVTLKQADNTLQQRGFEQTTSSYPPGCLSIRSHQSMDPPFKFKDGAPAEQIIKDRSYGPSCLLMKSEHSMDPSASFKEEIFVHERQSDQSEKLCPSATLRSFEERFMSLMEREMKKISQILSPGYGASVENSEEDQDSNNVREASLKIALHILRDMKEKDLVEKLIKFEDVHKLQKKLQSSLKHKSQHVFEGIAKQGNPALLNKIYTELYITEGGCGTPNDEHEVRQIESLNRVPTAQETAIKCNEIFKPLPGQDKCIRTVLTNGVAGIGKTFSVQKFILDWAEGKANQDVHLLFPLPFRELNLMREEKHTLEGLLHCFFKDIKNFPLSELQNYKVIFIFDGLDECRFPLDFRNDERCSDITKPTSLEIILTNLIAGNLLPCSLIWITSRPAAANQLPAHYIDQVTEVRGFNDLQKEEYFHKRISDPSLANKIIHHVKSSRSLHIMCHIPVFCWISATVLERRLCESDNHHIPKSLTEMYTHFLIFQTVQRHEKYTRGKDLQPCLTMKNLLSFGKLAFQQLYKGDLIFYEEDLQECGIDVKEASVYSGVCTQIFKEEFALFQKKFYSFVHLSFQEYLAALFVHLCWTGITESDQVQDHNLQKLCLNSTIFDLHKSAVNLALNSKQGHFDLFLRFLLGLSLESNQEMLCSLLQKKVSADTCQETVTYIKFMLGQYIRPESAINLFYCLQELNDHSLVQEIQTYLNTKSLSAEELSPALWSALVFVLLTNENLEVFDLRKYIKSDDGYKRLKPVAKASRTVILSSCNLTKNICHSLASILMLKTCAIRELDLSYNLLQDKGVAQLSKGLWNSNCRLKVLKLAFCGLTKTGCSHIASALLSNHGHLRELDLSFNLIGSEALTEPVALLPNSRIETLRLAHCNIKKEWCAFLASAASTTSFHLKYLDLSENTIGDLGARVFPELLSKTNCKLQSLNLINNWATGLCPVAELLERDWIRFLLSSCGFTERGFFDIASALKSNPTCLRCLDLSKNFPGKTATEKLCAAIRQPSCTLQTLCLDQCDLDSEICPALVKTLQNSSLRELSLSHNNLGDAGVTRIFTGLHNRQCTLKILRLANCSLTNNIFHFLAPALSLNTVGLSELDLSSNNLSQDRASFLCSVSYIHFIL